jgi:hypothetical protein
MDLPSSEHTTILSRSNASGDAAVSRLATRLTLAAIILLVAVLYLPPYKEAFVGDDYLQLGYIAGFLDDPLASLRVFHPLWTTWYYRPLQNLWFLAGRLLFALNPLGYYFLQVLVHSTVIAALYAFGRKLGLARAAALIAAALFAINTQHHDVVSWLSSIAIILVALFALLASSAYLDYLRRPQQPWRLLVALAFALLALFSHEEGILLLGFLLALRLLIFRHQRPRRAELAAALTLFLFTGVLVAIQFLRPNLTISLREQPASALLNALHPLEIGHFLVTIAGRWLFLDKTVFGVRLLSAISQLPLLELVLGAAILLCALLWFRRGNRAVRLSLLWVALHLGLLYVAVWTQARELFAGRHLYNAWAALALALAAEGTRAVRTLPEMATARSAYASRALLSALFLYIATSALLIGDNQRAWQQHTAEITGVETQMKTLLPEATRDTRIYAHRFALQPSFTPYAAAVWYQEPGIGGGSLQRLLQQSSLTSETVLFDYVDGRLYNLWPELQQYERTIPLWQPDHVTLRGVDSPNARGSYLPGQVAGPPGEQRLALELQPPDEGWLVLTYEAALPENGVLMVELLGGAGSVFRLTVNNGDSDVVVSIDESTSGAWQRVAIPLTGEQGPIVTLQLEASSPQGQAVHISVPRLVIGAID